MKLENRGQRAIVSNIREKPSLTLFIKMDMKIRKITAPIVLAVIFIGILLLLNAYESNSKQLYIIAAAVISVVVAYQIWPSSTLSVSIVLLIVSIIFPISVLYAIGNHDNLETPLSEILSYIEWHLFLMPFAAGVSTSFTIKRLTNRLSRN